MSRLFVARSLLWAIFLIADVTVSSNPLQPAAVPVLIDDHLIDGSIIHPYDNAWSITVRAKNGTVSDAGISSDHVRFRRIEGKRFLSRLETTASANGSNLADTSTAVSDTFNVFDPKTMRPALGESRSSNGEWQRRIFSSGTITLQTKSGESSPQTKVIPLTQPIYDVRGGMTGLLLATLPLRVGLVARFPRATASQDEIVVKVVGSQTVSAGHLGLVRAWVVEVGTAQEVYWVTKFKPYVIKVMISDRDGDTIWQTI